MSLHLGFHWGMVVKIAGKMCKNPSAVRKWIARMAAAAIAGYGIYAFVKRGIGSYMLMQVQFAFFGSLHMLYLHISRKGYVYLAVKCNLYK